MLNDSLRMTQQKGAKLVHFLPALQRSSLLCLPQQLEARSNSDKLCPGSVVLMGLGIVTRLAAVWMSRHPTGEGCTNMAPGPLAPSEGAWAVAVSSTRSQTVISHRHSDFPEHLLPDPSRCLCYFIFLVSEGKPKPGKIVQSQLNGLPGNLWPSEKLDSSSQSCGHEREERTHIFWRPSACQPVCIL